MLLQGRRGPQQKEGLAFLCLSLRVWRDSDSESLGDVGGDPFEFSAGVLRVVVGLIVVLWDVGLLDSDPLVTGCLEAC